MIPSLTEGLFSYAFDPVRVNYGLERVRFLSPVKVGSLIRDVVRIVKVEAGSTGTRVVFGHTVEIQGERRPTCIAETVSLLVVPVD